MISATLDTNVLVSAFVVPIGKPAQIVAKAREGEFDLRMSEDIFAETNIALHRRHIQKRFHPSEADIPEFLSALRDVSRIISILNVENLIPHDPPTISWLPARSKAARTISSLAICICSI